MKNSNITKIEKEKLNLFINTCKKYKKDIINVITAYFIIEFNDSLKEIKKEKQEIKEIVKNNINKNFNNYVINYQDNFYILKHDFFRSADYFKEIDPKDYRKIEKLNKYKLIGRAFLWILFFVLAGLVFISWAFIGVAVFVIALLFGLSAEQKKPKR